MLHSELLVYLNELSLTFQHAFLIFTLLYQFYSILLPSYLQVLIAFSPFFLYMHFRSFLTATSFPLLSPLIILLFVLSAKLFILVILLLISFIHHIFIFLVTPLVQLARVLVFASFQHWLLISFFSVFAKTLAFLISFTYILHLHLITKFFKILFPISLFLTILDIWDNSQLVSDFNFKWYQVPLPQCVKSYLIYYSLIFSTSFLM